MYAVRNWLLKMILCRLLSIHSKEPGANVCSRCSHVLNPNMYKCYRVTLQDGSEIDVKAINDVQAVRVVMFGYKDAKLMTKDANAGKRERAIKVWSDKIVLKSIGLQPLLLALALSKVTK